jgi:hypothetical protein
MTHEEIQILISAYIDGEVTPSEKNIVEEHLSGCAECQKNFKAYKAVSSSLSKWSNESLSPDEEIKIQKGFEQRRESMFTKKTAVTLATTLILTIVVGSVLQNYKQRSLQGRVMDASSYLTHAPQSMQMAFSSGSQGRLKSASEDIGDQFSPTNTNVIMAKKTESWRQSGMRKGLAQYEPYDMVSSYSIEDAGSTKRLAEGTLAYDASAARVRLGGEASTYYQNSDSSAYYDDQERKKIQRANLSLLVDNAFKTKSTLTDLVLQFNGIIVASEFSRSEDGSGRGNLVCKVYPKDLEGVLQQIRKLGEVEIENETSSDVTDQYNDTQNNLAKYAGEKERLQKALNSVKLFNPTTDEEKEATKRKIEQTIEQIGSLDRMIKFYKDQTNMSVIVVNYYDKYKTSLKENDSSNEWKTKLENKWKITKNSSVEVFSNILFGVLFLLSYVLPFLIWGIIFGIIYFIIRMFIKK